MMSKTYLLQLYILCFSLGISTTFCKSSGPGTKIKSDWIVELTPELDRNYLLDQYGQFRKMRIEVGKNPVNKSKNEWMITVFHTRNINHVTWQNIMREDKAILKFYPANNYPDLPVNDTIRGGKKITPKF